MDYWSGGLYKLKICQYNFFLQLGGYKNYKSLITNYILTQEQQEKWVCVLNSHRIPHLSFPPLGIQEIPCLRKILWLLNKFGNQVQTFVLHKVSL